MPVRATKRGAERTRFASDAATDVLICGASFAGLAVARELRASGAKVLVLDLGLAESIRQTFGSLLVHTPSVIARWPLPWTFSTFDYPTLCGLLWDQSGDAAFETAKVNGRTGNLVHTDRGDVRARVIVDALGWRRVLRTGAATTSSCGSTGATSGRATAGRSRPATSWGSASARSTRACTSRIRH